MLTYWAERKIAERSKPINVPEFKVIVERLLQLRRIGLLSDDEALVLVAKYVELKEVTRD